MVSAAMVQGVVSAAVVQGVVVVVVLWQREHGVQGLDGAVV